MFVEPIYKGFRIQVEAVEVEGRWDATVNIHRVFSDEKPYIERVTCRKLTAELAERLAAIWARRWVDLNRRDGGHV
jgi:N-formylglutamate amidohydrolase